MNQRVLRVDELDGQRSRGCDSAPRYNSLTIFRKCLTWNWMVGIGDRMHFAGRESLCRVLRCLRYNTYRSSLPRRRVDHSSNTHVNSCELSWLSHFRDASFGDPTTPLFVPDLTRSVCISRHWPKTSFALSRHIASVHLETSGKQCHFANVRSP